MATFMVFNLSVLNSRSRWEKKTLKSSLGAKFSKFYQKEEKPKRKKKNPNRTCVSSKVQGVRDKCAPPYSRTSSMQKVVVGVVANSAMYVWLNDVSDTYLACDCYAMYQRVNEKWIHYVSFLWRVLKQIGGQQYSAGNFFYRWNVKFSDEIQLLLEPDFSNRNMLLKKRKSIAQDQGSTRK